MEENSNTKKSIITRLNNYISDDSIELRERILSVTLGVVIAGTMLSCIPLFVYGMVGVWLNLLLAACCTAGMIAVMKYRKLDQATFIVTYLANILILPGMYFTQGGVHSAMPIWAGLIAILSYILVNEKIKLPTFACSLLISLACVITEFVHPSLVTPLKSEGAFFFDIIVGMTVSSVILFLVFTVHLHTDKKHRILLEEQKRELEALYERDKAESRESLEKALAEAKRANEAKSAFLSRMSHDIRTPLNGIIGLMEINDKHADDRQLIDENRAKAKVAANHLLSLISDVLELSKLDSENVQLVNEPLSIPELVSDILTITELRASEAGITLEQKGSLKNIKAPYVYGSPLHIRQIFVNLFGNAIKYNKPAGIVAFWIDTLSLTETDVVYKVVIADTGIGMSEEFLQHLYEPFSQEHSDVRSTYQGTGLGMAIVKSLVEKMNGTIEVESTLGEGSTFSVTLPFKIAQESELPKKRIEGKKDLTGLKVLLAEDNDLNMEIATTILEDFGAVVTSAQNGSEAVEMFANHAPGTFDLILMDLMMPVLDGFGATAAIRNLDREDAKTLPIIAMTANAFAEDERKCLEAGMNGHLSKPFDVNRLVDMLSAHME